MQIKTFLIRFQRRHVELTSGDFARSAVMFHLSYACIILRADWYVYIFVSHFEATLNLQWQSYVERFVVRPMSETQHNEAISHLYGASSCRWRYSHRCIHFYTSH